MIHHHSEDQGRHWAVPRQLRREDTTVDIGSHIYGRDGGDGLFDDEHPVIKTVVDELCRRGAINRADVDLLLPQLEQDLGALSDRERAAVMARFDR